MALPALPTDWGSYDAARKIAWFNANNVTVGDLREAGVSEPEIQWIVLNGMTPGGVSLPQDWFTRTGQSKVDWFIQNRITEQQLLALGISAQEISDIKSIYNYVDIPAKEAKELEQKSNQAIAGTASSSTSNIAGKIAILGDSLSSALGYDTTGAAQKNLTDILGNDITNVSRGGMTTYEALTGNKPDSLSGLQEASAFAPFGGTFETFLTSFKPETVLLRYGAADAALLKNPETTIANIEKMIQLSKTAGSNPVLVGIPPVAKTGDARHGGVYGNYFDFMPPLVDAINSGMQNLAEKYGIKYIDLSGIQIPQGGLLDGLHPNVETGEIIARAISDQIKTIPTTQTTTAPPTTTAPLTTQPITTSGVFKPYGMELKEGWIYEPEFDKPFQNPLTGQQLTVQEYEANIIHPNETKWEGKWLSDSTISFLKGQINSGKSLYNLNFQTPGNSDAWHTDDIAKRLTALGITNLDQIGVDQTKGIYNKATGNPLNTSIVGGKGGNIIGSTGAGAGYSNYIIQTDAFGSPIIVPEWNQSNFLAKNPLLTQVLAMGASLLVPGIGQAIAPYVSSVVGAAAAPAVSNFLVRTAVNTIFNGGDLSKAFLGAATGTALNMVTDVVANELANSGIISGATAAEKLATARLFAGPMTNAIYAIAQGQDPLPTLLGGAVNAAISTGINEVANAQKLDPTSKALLQIGVSQAINTARTGTFNPVSLFNQLLNLGFSQAQAGKMAGGATPDSAKSNTAIGAVAVDKNGELYTIDDDGNRLMLSGNSAGRVYTPTEWNSIQTALSAGQAQYVNGLINAMNSGTIKPEDVTSDLKNAGYSDAKVAEIFAANQQFVDRAKKTQELVSDYTAVGSDLSRESALERLRSLGFDEADANTYISNIDKQVTARNNYVNVSRDYINGAATESQLQSAMDAAGIKGDLANQQLLYYRAIKAGDELTSSEATQAAVAGLRSWNVIDRKGTQVSWDLNDDGTPYVKAARDASGKDITDLFYGSSPQAVQKYAIEDQQRYVDRFQKQLTTTAEKYFAPGSKVTPDQAVAMLKQTDGMTDAMAKDLVGRWDQQKEAVARNGISYNQETGKTTRILTPEEFERVMSKANVDMTGDKFNQRYQAYLYTNGELLRTGNAKDGFVLPGEVVEVFNKGKNITQLPTNTFIDEVGKAVSEGIKAGQSIGSPAQNFINSLSANFLGLFPRAGAGIVSVVSGDAANDVAVALRGIAKIASDSSDALMPDLASEANKWMGKISEAQGPGAKLGAAWQWASDSPTSFGSLAWTAGKELSEDMISFALMGKALKTIGTAPGVALGSALTDFALNYGGVTEENISQLINQGLSSEQAASLAGQGAMPAAIAETIVGGIAALVPSAKTAIKDLISLPYKATVDGVEEAASYVFNQKGLGQSIDLNDFWTSGVIAATVGGAGHGGASLSVFLSPQGQGQVIKDASDLGLSISQDPFLIPETARATITSVIGNTAVMKGPSGQTYVADLGNQNITAGQQVNIYSLDTTPVQITPSEMKDYLSLVNQAYQGQLGRNPTADEVGFAIKDLSGVGQLQEKLNATQEGQRFDQLVETFKTTIGRNPTADEIKANITRLGNNEITLNQLKQELAKTNEGVLYEQKQIFNAQTDAQIAANAKSLLDQGKTTYADFKTFMNSMGLASDRQLNVLDTITPRANVAGTVTSIIGDNAVVTGTDGQMYTMLRVAPNNYLMQVGDQVKLGVSTVKPTATPTVEVTTKIADVIAASVSKSTSISLSQSVSEAAVSTSISKSQSLSVSYSQSQSLSASTSVSVSESQSKSISLSQSVSTVELEKSISLSKSVSTSVSTSASLSTSTSLSQSVSASTSTSQSVSASISKSVSISEAVSLSASVSEQMEKDRLKGLSISASLSESISKAVSVSESISKAVSISESTSASISTSQSISKATSISQSLSASTSQSESVSKATSISASVSASTSASLSASTSQSISLSQEVSKQVSISQSTSQSIALSQSLSQSQAVSVSASVSESVSKSVSTSLSLSQSTSAALSSSASQSLSLSQKMSEDIVRGLSISASLSASQSVSQSVSRLVSASISTSQSASTSLSLSESISKATQLSISNSLSASASVSQSQSLSASQSVSKALSQSVSQSLSLSESVAQSISQSLSLSALQSQSLSVSEQIERDRAVGISISNSLSQSVSLEASKSQSISISTSTQQSISNSVSLSESVSISTYLSQEVSRQTSLSQSLSTANSLSLSLSQSQSLSQSLSQTQTVSITPSITQTVSVTETIAPTATVAPSVTESITQTVTQSVTESITEVVTQSLTETLTPSITATITQLPTLAPTITASATITPSISVTETFTQTPSLTMVITTTSLPPVTTTITIPPVTTTEPVTTEQVTTITIPPVTPPPTSGTIPPVTTPTISIPEQTTTAPVTTLPVTTAPVTSATTTSKPPTTTAKPGGLPFPIFGIPAATGQQKTYVDYAQPNVPAPEFGPFDLFKAPSYLRPLQDTGNFGLAALLGAANAKQSGDGNNQSQQNAEGQGQAPKG